MKRNGSLTIAISLMLLVIIWIIFIYNQGVGLKLIWFWPIILIVLGIEILINYKKHKIRKKFNFGIIIILIIAGFSEGLMQNWDVVNQHTFIKSFKIKMFTEKIDLSKTIDTRGIKEINIGSNSLDIKLYRANDDSLTFNGEVETVEEIVKEYEDNFYYIENGKLNLNFRKFNAKSIKGDLYVPKGIKVNMDINGGRIVNIDPLEDTEISAKGDYCNFDFRKIKKLKLENTSGQIYIRDIKDAEIKSKNMNISLEGYIDKLNLQGEDGEVNGKINTFSNLNIDSKWGKVKINSKEKNFILTGEVKAGDIRFNDKTVNGKIKEIIGEGKNKINIELDKGSVYIRCEE